MPDPRMIAADEARRLAAEPERLLAARADAWDEGYERACADVNWDRPRSTRRITDNPYRAPRPAPSDAYALCGGRDPAYPGQSCMLPRGHSQLLGQEDCAFLVVPSRAEVTGG